MRTSGHHRAALCFARFRHGTKDYGINTAPTLSASLPSFIPFPFGALSIAAPGTWSLFIQINFMNTRKTTKQKIPVQQTAISVTTVMPKQKHPDDEDSFYDQADYEFNNGPTGHGDICFSDADPGL